MIIYSWFTYYKWWFSIAMLKYQGVYIYIIFILVVWNIWIIFHTLGIVIPIDFHIFQRGRYTTNQIYIYMCVCELFTSSIFMGWSVNKWYSINYIYCWLIFLISVDMKLLAETVFFGDLDLLLSSWFHPMHPAARTAYSKYTTDFLHGFIYIYILYTYIYIYMKMAYTIVSHGFYNWF